MNKIKKFFEDNPAAYFYLAMLCALVIPLVMNIVFALLRGTR